MAEATVPYRPRARHNMALVAGGLLTALVVIVALLGPLLAPKDPMENAYIGRTGTRFIRPPFPPGAVEGYPLGSDELGRDVLSKVLWAVRPTMSLVLVVAGVRLLVGLGVGLLAGWSTGRASRVLDSVIAGALAIPVLFIALCVVAALAQRWGLLAFIVGLSITGWAETARLVHDQTRAIKAQPFVEASEALGAEEGQVVFSHVLPHVLPLIWIQLAFEISATVVTVAALGFLGYFINAVWVPGETDFVGIRASGAPELGQMLGVAVRRQPWTAMIAGSSVFLIVLAFNLLGEGIRQSLNERRRPTSPVAAKAGSWLEERLYLAMAGWRRLAATAGAVGALVLAVLAGSWFLLQSQQAVLGASKIVVPGGHTWAAALRDAQGTSWSQFSGPALPDAGWQVRQAGGFTGGPLIDASGNLYLTGADQKLYSYDAAGELRWTVPLSADALGWPAMAPDGSIVVAGVEGSLWCFTPVGQPRWQYASDPPDEGLSSPVIGPTGMVYYAVKNFLVAVSAEGERAWQIRLPTYSYTSPLPRLSADGKLLFFEDFVIDARTGATQFRESPELLDKYIVGADGKTYLRTAEAVEEWQQTETGAVRIPRVKLDENVIGAGFRFPYDSGVSPSGNVWLLYASGYEFMRLVWLDPRGQSPQLIDFPYRNGLFAGIDSQGLAYVCGLGGTQPVECRAVELRTGMIVWKQEYSINGALAGGALADGRLYVVSSGGDLVMVGK